MSGRQKLDKLSGSSEKIMGKRFKGKIDLTIFKERNEKHYDSNSTLFI